jgi:hypothetical protein
VSDPSDDDPRFGDAPASGAAELSIEGEAEIASEAPALAARERLLGGIFALSAYFLWGFLPPFLSGRFSAQLHSGAWPISPDRSRRCPPSPVRRPFAGAGAFPATHGTPFAKHSLRRFQKNGPTAYLQLKGTNKQRRNFVKATAVTIALAAAGFVGQPAIAADTIKVGILRRVRRSAQSPARAASSGPRRPAA